MIQVITKVVEYDLKPGQSHEDYWHVEGMPQEDIVLSLLYVLNVEGSKCGGEMMFQKPYSSDQVDYIQDKCHGFLNGDDPMPEATAIGLKEGLELLGKVELIPGSLVVYPNSAVTKMTEMVNDIITGDLEDNSVSCKKTILLFHLVNPLRRIASTREVTPQRTDEALPQRERIMQNQKSHRKYWNACDGSEILRRPPPFWAR